MAFRSNIKNKPRGTHYALSGDDTSDGFTLERPKATIPAAINAAVALLPAPSIDEPVSVTEAQGGIFIGQVTLADFVTLHGPETTIIGPVDAGFSVDISELQDCKFSVANVSTSPRDVSINSFGAIHIFDVTNVSVNVGVINAITLTSCGLVITSECKNLTVNASKMNLSADDSWGVFIEFLMTGASINLNYDNTSITANDCIFFQYNPGSLGNVCTFKTSSVIQESATTNNKGYIVRSDHLIVESTGVLIVDDAIKVESGGRLSYTGPFVRGTITVDAGGILDAAIQDYVGVIINNGTINGFITSGTHTVFYDNKPNVAARDFFVQDFGNWTYKSVPENNSWLDAQWAAELGLFCAVSNSGTNRVMTSPDGITWTARSAASNMGWLAIAWSPALKLFVAISGQGSFDDIMTSPDGIIWTTRVAPSESEWEAIAWSPALKLFVITGASVIGTSPDGINWTSRTPDPAAIGTSLGIAWSSTLKLFCICGSSASEPRMQTSPDGINWTARNSALEAGWRSVIWVPELSLFICTGSSTINQGIQTSPDGVNWTIRTTPSGDFSTIEYAQELGLVLVVGAHISIFSIDGITWSVLGTAISVIHNGLSWSPDLGKFAIFSDAIPVLLSPAIEDVNLTDITVETLNQPVFGSDDGLVCHIPIIETTGLNQYDRSPTASDGVAGSGVTVAQGNGRFGGIAGNFDGGVDTAITCETANLVYGTNPRTMCIQALTNTIAAGLRGACSYGTNSTNQGYFISQLDSSLRLGGFNSDFNIEDYWEVGVWHEIVLTFDGTTVQVFSDGEFIHEEDLPWNTVESECLIGQQLMMTDQSWDGALANFKVYDRVLDSAEIRTAYLRGSLFNSSSVITADKFRVIDTNDNINTVSLLGINEIDVHFASDIDKLAVAGVITVTTNLTITMKVSSVIISSIFVLVGGGILSIKGEDFAGRSDIICTNAGTFVSGEGTFFINSSLQIISAVAAKFLDLTGGSIQFVDAVATGFSDLGSVSNGQIFFMADSLLVAWGAPFVLTNMEAIIFDNLGSFLFPTVNMVEIYDPAQVGLTLEIKGVAGQLQSASRIVRLDPDIPDNTSILINANSFTGGSLFDTSGGVTGAFTAVADATAISTSLDSVSDSAGIARFNFTPGPVVFIGQEVVLSGFITNTAYNFTGIITVAGVGFFEIARIPFGSDEASGSFTSESVTVTDVAHGLSELQTLTIAADFSTDYKGGATIYNVLTDSFQINRLFTTTHTGTWNTAGIDQADTRVLARTNPTIVDTHYIGCSYVNVNDDATTGLTNDVFSDVVFGTVGDALIACTTMEGLVLTNELNGEHDYMSKEPFSGTINYVFSVSSSGGSIGFLIKWVVDRGAGFVDLDDPVETPITVGSSPTNISPTHPLKVVLGDKVKPQVARTSGNSDIVFSFAVINISQ